MPYHHEVSFRNAEDKNAVKRMFDTIVFSGVCSGCAACVVACPVGVTALTYEVDKPILLDACIDCLLCAQACPRLDYQTIEIKQMVYADQPVHEDEGFGPYLEIIGARSTDTKVLERGQDGGIVTAILGWALDTGQLEGVVTSGRSADDPWQPEPRLVTTSEQLLACGGSTYTYSPNTLAVQDVAAQKLERVAFVGVPCEVSAIRKLEIAKSKRSRNAVKPVQYVFGLMCSETFTYEEFIEDKIEAGLGLDRRDIWKINIKGKVLVYTRDGNVHTIPLREVRPFAREGCHYCQDFSGEEADISVGGLGLEGWTITVLRTEKGRKLFYDAVDAGVIETRPASDFEKALELLVKLSAKQRARPTRPVEVEDGVEAASQQA